MKNLRKAPLVVALGSAIAATFSVGVANADTNPFAMSEMSQGYMQMAGIVPLDKKGGSAKTPKKTEGVCGEGRCAAMMKDNQTQDSKMKEGMEKTCGAMMKGKEGACGAMGSSSTSSDKGTGDAAAASVSKPTTDDKPMGSSEPAKDDKAATTNKPAGDDTIAKDPKPTEEGKTMEMTTPK